MLAPARGAALADWLLWIEATHPDEIELGLARAHSVAAAAGVTNPLCPIITVAGTNGKGSTVAMLAAMYEAAGYRTGVYTSPHILNFNERIVVNSVAVSDALLVDAFEKIESARGDTALTYFEFSTLAAMQVFIDATCEIILLEVGLGGRLDTTNIWDADCAIVSSIAIDHVAWLGNDRTAIGLEKIGIGRAEKPMVIAEQDTPAAVLTAATDMGVRLLTVPPAEQRSTLSLLLPGTHQQLNAHAALLAVSQLQPRCPLPLNVALAALAKVQVPGRFEQHCVNGIQVVLDVAHNPAAARSVVAGFRERHPDSPVFAVFGALDDKDITGVATELGAIVQHWHCIPLDFDRASSPDVLNSTIARAGGVATSHSSLSDGWKAASTHASAYNSKHSHVEAVVLVAGSFFTLAAWHAHWQNVGRFF